MIYDSLNEKHGLGESHSLMLAAVPYGSRVLDVGCSTGYLSLALRDDRGATVVGLEFVPAAAEAARARGIEVVIGSVEDPEVLARFEDPFDAIVIGDVLEHLADPWAALARLVELLRPGGILVASLPNVAHWTVRRALLRGRWPREDHGLFDRTHLRWFARSDMHELFASAGLEVTGDAWTQAPLPFERGRLPDHVRKAVVNRAPELFALQFVVTGQRPADAR
jgi:methionine biosynthesis protein MetW